LSNKSGPNGPATLFAEADSEALLQDTGLLKDIQALLNISLPGLNISQFQGRYKENKKLVHSKTILLSDQAGKTRVVSIAD